MVPILANSAAQRVRFRCWIRMILLAVTVAAGCERQAPPPTQQEVHLKALAVGYGMFIGNHRGRPPADEEEFKAFLRSLPPEQLPGQPGDIDALFVSPRDNQPYVVRYNIGSTMPGPGQPMEVVAYEQTGVGGRRYVAFALGGVEEVSEDELEKIIPDGG
jgi:hypothetical protein